MGRRSRDTWHLTDHGWWLSLSLASAGPVLFYCWFSSLPLLEFFLSHRTFLVFMPHMSFLWTFITLNSCHSQDFNCFITCIIQQFIKDLLSSSIILMETKDDDNNRKRRKKRRKRRTAVCVVFFSILIYVSNYAEYFHRLSPRIIVAYLLKKKTKWLSHDYKSVSF